MTEDLDKDVILIVDDNPHNLYSLKSILSQDSRLIDIVQSGAEALTYLARNKVSLILLDIQMPDMDGFETAQLIRQRRSLQDIPIIFLTAFYKSEEFISKGFASGAYDYLTKPLDNTLIRNKVDIFLRLYRQQQQLELLNSRLEVKVTERSDKLLEVERKILDIEKQKAEEHALIVNESPTAMFMLDADGQVVMANKKASKVFGYSETELMGFNIDDLLSESSTLQGGIFLKKYHNQPELKLVRKELFGHHKEGFSIPVDVAFNSLNNRNKYKILCNVSDLSERKKMQSDLYALTEKLKQTNTNLSNKNRELNEFAYIASHDLQAPLRGIHHLCQWLEEDFDKQDEAGIKKNLHRLKERTIKMQSLIDDLLMFSRSGSISAIPEPVDIKELINDIVEDIVLPKKFSVTVKTTNIKTFETVKTPLQTVFRNLINNAYLHHDKEQGQIIVTAELKEKVIIFHVIDDGPGIPYEEHDRVFKIFQSGRRQPVHGGARTGIGLAITRRLIETCGETVRIENHSENGTNIRFSWPLQWKTT